MRHLTLLQRQRITLSLFFAVAMGAVVTVAAPAFVPWQVVDEKREQALEQQRRQGIDFHVVPNPRRRGGGTLSSDHQQDGSKQRPASQSSSPSPNSSPLPLSTFTGALFQQNRIPLASPSDVELAWKQIESEHGSASEGYIRTTDPAPQDGEGVKKKRRRRRRKKVNEGWQELTGRTAREEKAKAEAEAEAAAAAATGRSDFLPATSLAGHDMEENGTSARERKLGENGGQEIEWSNKAWQHSEPVS
ncbi:hypothetical protein DFQ27_000480 [Actinomortierella ambigua]|uniref:Transmembrane protein n=1 Tax=Actinomortierella ambigua TaxID=1343610 RepID=A0A9P6QGD7_9FUNG|nr:hypothetical protein DFQ27_000480 [Actinomortierella ambigua]